MECIRCGRTFDITQGECPKCRWSADSVWGATAGYTQGQKVKNYRIVGSLGLSPLSAIIEISDTKSKSERAMEVIHPALCPDDIIGDGFIEGMKSLAGIWHPNLTPVYDVDRDGDKFYVVRDFVSGSTLRQLIDRRQKYGRGFEVPEILALFEQLVAIYQDTAIEVHGSLYPERIWSVSGRLKVVGFGIAVHLPPEAVYYRMTRVGRIREYVPPELAEGTRPDPRSDVFALGMLLGELATSLWELGGERRAYRQGLMGVIGLAANPDPNKRYSSPQELLWAMYDVMGRFETDLAADNQTRVAAAPPTEAIAGIRDGRISESADALPETDVIRHDTLPPPSPAMARRHAAHHYSSPIQVRSRVSRREVTGTRRYVLQGYEQIAECPTRREITQDVSLEEMGAVEMYKDEEGDSAAVAIDTLEQQLETATISSMSRLKKKSLALDGVYPRYLRAAVKIEIQKISDVTHKIAARIRQRGRRLNGIDPKLIRAAAWLEEAQVNQVVPGDGHVGVLRKPDSYPPPAEGSVISFVAPALSGSLNGIAASGGSATHTSENVTPPVSADDTLQVERD